MEPKNQKILVCLNCSSAYPDVFILQKNKCPDCGTHVPPRDPDQDIEVNWEDCRFLASLANKYISSIDNLPPALVEEYAVLVRSLNAGRPKETAAIEI